MTDRFAQIVQSDIGAKLADLLGLPKPAVLRRHTPGDPLVDGVTLIGGAPGGTLLDEAAGVLADAAVDAVDEASQHESMRYAAVIYDASGITSSADLGEMYRFVQSGVRRLTRNARVIVLSTTPELIEDGKHRVAQRSIEGFTRSVAKELSGGSTCQLIEVAPGAERGLASPLRFVLSGRSAFVTGQVLRVGPGTDHLPIVPADHSAPLAGKVAVVTGAARGIGAAIAEVLSRDGAHVVCLDVPQAGQQLAQVANAVGGESFQLDVTADDAPARLIDHLVERHGGVDIVVHNAGITRDKTLAGMDDARWDLVLAVNLIAVERINDELLAREALNENGRVVCLSSAIGGIAGNRGQSNYGATKAGIIGHVEVLAATLAKIGATANAVAPGFIETEMTGTMPFGPREVGRRISSLGQGGLPIDVAETIAYLSGPDASWVNGTTLRVCGQNLIGA
jgi:3-oxoacyl-[acyl-carrier protein] reductase